jgi:UDP-N-acetylglucosamine 2-epimerase (non-hydrolysing)
MTGRIALVLGTRPEIIKLACLSRELGDRGYIVHSGQHYDDSLSQAFFDTYGLTAPEVQLTGVGGAVRGDQFAAILTQLTAHLVEQGPAAVVVQGDTNTAAAGAQAASFLGIPVVHVEAGLRSYDRAMPEEINRQLIGVVAELHCAPTETAAGQLLAEGIAPARVRVTGNTVVEATLMTLPSQAARADLLVQHGVVADAFVLATIHRPENTDDPRRLQSILTALAGLGSDLLLPLHPRTRGCVERFGLSPLLDGMRVVEPVDHPTFLALARHAKLLVSDSGGVQEECTVIKRPLVVLRNSTERPEAIDAGFAQRLVPSVDLPGQLADLAADDGWLDRLVDLPSPYGDGTASLQIAKAIIELVD